MKPEEFREVDIRDAAMAETVSWVRAQEGTRGRILVFAHDGHVMNAPSRGGIWSVFSEAPRMMGQHLRSAFGEKLVIIGTVGGRNAPSLPRVAQSPEFAEEALAQLGPSNFLLDLRSIPAASPAGAWARVSRPIHANFSTQLEVELRTAVDVIWYVEELTAALPNTQRGH